MADPEPGMLQIIAGSIDSFITASLRFLEYLFDDGAITNGNNITYSSIKEIFESYNSSLITPNDEQIYFRCRRYLFNWVQSPLEIEEMVATINGRRDLQSKVIAIVRMAIDTQTIPPDVFDEAVDMNQGLDIGGPVAENARRLAKLIPILRGREVGISTFDAHIVWLSWIISLARAAGEGFAERRAIAKIAEDCGLEFDLNARFVDRRVDENGEIIRPQVDGLTDSEDEEEDLYRQEFLPADPADVRRPVSERHELLSFDCALPMTLEDLNEERLGTKLALIPLAF